MLQYRRYKERRAAILRAGSDPTKLEKIPQDRWTEMYWELQTEIAVAAAKGQTP